MSAANASRTRCVIRSSISAAVGTSRAGTALYFATRCGSDLAAVPRLRLVSTHLATKLSLLWLALATQSSRSLRSTDSSSSASSASTQACHNSLRVKGSPEIAPKRRPSSSNSHREQLCLEFIESRRQLIKGVGILGLTSFCRLVTKSETPLLLISEAFLGTL